MLWQWFKRKREEAKLKKILKRCKMDKFEYNTGVVRGTATNEGDRRIAVGSHFGNMNWGDCVSIRWFTNGGQWNVMHVSPARARLIAQHLLDQADRIEDEFPDSMNIDKPLKGKTS